MSLIDKLIWNIIMGFIIFVTLFCAGWWFCYLLGFDIIKGMIVGIFFGSLINLFFLKRIVNRIYDINVFVLILVYALYMVGIFGFFMGVPAFNVIPGIMASFYIGRKMKFKKVDEATYRANLKRVIIFSSIGLIVVCLCSAYLAISDPYTAKNIQGMFNLGFEVTNIMIWWAILLGGLTLLCLQYFSEKVVGKVCFSK